MAEAPSDWKVQVTLDRKAIVEDIDRLVRMLARQRVAVTVSAWNDEEAIAKARAHLELHSDISEAYMKAFNPRRLPT
jgi:hypothetical protein